MIEIIPAIMPKDMEDLKHKISLVTNFVDTIQLDIMDGEFVPDQTLPFDQPTTYNLQSTTFEDVDFELDLMVFDADKKLDLWMQFEPKRIIFHIEAIENLKKFLGKELKAYLKEEEREIDIGLAINITTAIEKTFPFIKSGSIDFIQCMGIEKIGFQGEPFDKRVLDHIGRLQEEYPDVIISVDGGVNMRTAPQLVEAGVNRLVIGSAIFESKDIKKTIEEFKNLT